MKGSEQWTGVVILSIASVAPLIFPVSQAGYASMDDLGVRVLIPSIAVGLLLALWTRIRGMATLQNRILAGAGAGILATAGLEVVRGISYHYGGMPGNLPELMGVLLTGRIMEGPNVLSDLAGWGYHFWNGLCFGVIYAIVFGRRRAWVGIVYGVLIGFAFLISPAVSSLGIGFMGREMPSMPLTVVVAHGVFGALLGYFAHRWIGDGKLGFRPSPGPYRSRIVVRDRSERDLHE